VKRLLKTKQTGYVLAMALLLFVSGNFLHAQVTIGSGIPPLEGNLLDLKENELTGINPNATKGLGLPRVALSSLTTLTIDNDSAKDKYVGTIVYNTTTNSMLSEGMYYWDKNTWVKVSGSHPWFKIGTTVPSTLNKDDSYLDAKAVIGGTSLSLTEGNKTAQLSVVGSTVLNGDNTSEPLYMRNIKSTKDVSNTEYHSPLVISSSGVVRKAEVYTTEILSTPNYAVATLNRFIDLFNRSSWIPGSPNNLVEIGEFRHISNAGNKGNYIVLPEDGIYMISIRGEIVVNYVNHTTESLAIPLDFTYNVADYNGISFDYAHFSIVVPSSGAAYNNREFRNRGFTVPLYVSGKKGDKFKIRIRFDSPVEDSMNYGVYANIDKVAFNAYSNQGYVAISLSKISEMILNN